MVSYVDMWLTPYLTSSWFLPKDYVFPGVDDKLKWWEAVLYYWAEWWPLGGAIILACMLAHLTNPPPLSFRTHLTSQSFTTHLSPASSTTPSKPSSSSPKDSSPALSFSSRITLSIRTPPYDFWDYGLFSIVWMTDPTPPPSSPGGLFSGMAMLGSGGVSKKKTRGGSASGRGLVGGGPRSGEKKKRKERDKKDEDKSKKESGKGEVWLGVWGRWIRIRGGSDEVAAAVKDAAVLKVVEPADEEASGLTGTSAPSAISSGPVEAFDDSTPTPASSAASSTVGSPIDSIPPTPSPTSAQQQSLLASASSALSSSSAAPTIKRPTARSSSSSNKRLLLRTSQQPTTSLARLREKVAGSTPTATSANLTGNGIGSSSFDHTSHSGPTGDEEEVEVLQEEEVSSEPDEPITHIIGAAGGEAGVLRELKNQLEELEQSSRDNEKKLLGEIEVLKNRKKDEDVLRGELKARLKILEENKRIAEGKKHDAERLMGEKVREVKEVVERTERVKEEVERKERREKEGREKKEKKKRDRREKVKTIKEEVVEKKVELESVKLESEKREKDVQDRLKEVEEKRKILDELLVAAGRRGGYPHPGVIVGGQRRHTGDSRPGSLRSFDPNAAPSLLANSNYSPPTTHPVAAPHPHQGFFEHRSSHLLSHPSHSTSTDFLHQNHPTTIATTSDFHPFDFDGVLGGSVVGNIVAGSGAGSSGGGRPKLSLPLQYLDSGLLEGGEIGDQNLTGPLSPMTPSQACLIPKQLFELLDKDDDDDIDPSGWGRMLSTDELDDDAWPESPTRRVTTNSGSDWRVGLGLSSAIVGGSTRNRENSLSPTPTAVKTAPTSPATPTSNSPWEDASSTMRPSPTWDNSHLPSSSSIISGQLQRPTTTAVIADDLPRHGLSLNPDAKAFAFRPGNSTGPPSGGSSGGSKMEFAQRGLSFDWPRSRSGSGGVGGGLEAGSSSVSIGGSNSAGLGKSAFNPFDLEDDLLGPLKE